MLPNPNRPLVGVDTDFTLLPPNKPGASAMSLSSRGCVVTEVSARHGRQNELGRCESGTAGIMIHDPYELLNPMNTGSAFNSGANSIQPYRPLWIWSLWNLTSNNYAGNILNSNNQAPGQPVIGTAANRNYGYDANFENWNLGIAVVSNDGSTATSVTSPADGTYPVTQVSMATANSTYTYGLRAVVGQPYSVSFDVYANPGVTVTLHFGATVVSSTVTGAYQTLTLPTITAVLNCNVTFTASTTGAYPAVFYVANIRLQGLMPGWQQTVGSAMSYTLAQAHSGNYSCGTVMTASTDSMSLPVQTAPDITYTMSCWVYAVGAGSVVRMSAGGSTASSSTVGGWQQLAVTFVATDAVTTVSWSATAGTFPVSFYLDDIQFEIGATASAFTMSGPTYRYIHTGFVERYAQSWADAGTRGIRMLEVVDALSILSRVTINQSYAATILPDNPTVYIPWNDQGAPTTVQRIAGGQPMTGYTNLGPSGSPSVNYGGDTFLDGGRAITVVQQNANPLVSGDPNYVTYAGTRNGSVTMSPQSFTLEAWLKFSSGTAYIGAAAVQPGENTNTEAAGPQYYAGWYTSAGKLMLLYADPNGGAKTLYGIGNGAGGWGGYPDGVWHYFALAFTGSSKVQSTVDSAVGGLGALASAPSQAVNLNNFFADATTYFGDPISAISVANMATYPTALTSTQVGNHYQRGIGYVGELSGTRANRLLTQYWSSNILTATGRSLMSADYYYNGKSLLAALLDIADTEDGLVWADGAGVVRFDSRDTRYLNSPTSAYTFGENTGAGELPYKDLKYDYDPNKVYSGAAISNPAGTVFTAGTGPRIFTKTAYLQNNWDVQQAANFYSQRYATARMRISRLQIDPASNPRLWRAALTLDVGDRVTVNRRTSAGVTMTGDYYIEQLQHDIKPDKGAWTVTYQLSPVFVPTVGKLGDATYGVLGSTTYCIY